MATLNDLMNDWREVKEMAMDPDIDPEAIADTLEGIEGALEDKADGYAAVIDFCAMNVELIKAETDRLKNRRMMFEAKADRMKRSLEDMMRETGKLKFDTALHRFGIQKNPPRVIIDHPEAVPKLYKIEQEPKIDTKRILADLKAGELIAWAHLEQGESLRIR